MDYNLLSINNDNCVTFLGQCVSWLYLHFYFDSATLCFMFWSILVFQGSFMNIKLILIPAYLVHIIEKWREIEGENKRLRLIDEWPKKESNITRQINSDRERN